MATDLQRFTAKVDPRPDGCIVWTAYTNHHGYGVFSVRSRTILAHRWAWTAVHGPVPEGMQLDHLCRTRACVNVNHLEVVTPSVNTKRGLAPILLAAINGEKKHCPRGHPYDEENTYRKSTGSRQCRACNRAKAVRKVACSFCGKEVSRSNLSVHVRRMHAEAEEAQARS